jgi:hypothetical protein
MLEDPYPKTIRNIVNFADKALDVSASDVANVLNIPAGTIVLDVFMRSITAETAEACVDLGYSGSTAHWGKSLNMDTTAGNIIPRALYATATWDPASCPSYVAASGASHISVDTTVAGAALGDIVLVSSNLDLVDIQLSGSVTVKNVVTAVIANHTGSAVNLDSHTLKIVVLKAPQYISPVYFSSAGTIDILGTQGIADVDIDAAKVEVIALTLPVRN